MADFSQLKAAVANVIKTNGNEEITGAILQDVLLTIINSIAGGYMFGGVAQHSGNVGNPDYNVFYLAGSGSYTGYGGAVTIENGCYGVFRYNGSWTQEVVDIGVRLSGSVTAGETRGCTGDTINSALQQLFDNITSILDTMAFVYNTPSAQQATKAMLDVQVTVGGNAHVLGTLTLVAATALQAGLMSAEDKQKVDAFLTNLRSLTFADTTAQANVGTQITETMSATIGGDIETIATFTLLAATASKAGLMSATDKTYLDSLPAALTSIVNTASDNLSRVLAMLGYYECSTAAATAAKTVSASGYTLTNGGCIRIKMTNANTANSVTLNINSTGAKALYYDGAQASSSNSWEAGEVLEVYYDGTQYQCASGGGGKFETGQKVKETGITNEVDDSTALVTASAVGKAIAARLGGTFGIDLFTKTENISVEINHSTMVVSNSASNNYDKYKIHWEQGGNLHVILGGVYNNNSAPVSFYSSDEDTTANLITYLNSNENVSQFEATIPIPEGTKCIVVCNKKSVLANPTIEIVVTDQYSQQIQQVENKLKTVYDYGIEKTIDTPLGKDADLIKPLPVHADHCYQIKAEKLTSGSPDLMICMGSNGEMRKLIQDSLTFFYIPKTASASARLYTNTAVATGYQYKITIDDLTQPDTLPLQSETPSEVFSRAEGDALKQNVDEIDYYLEDVEEYKVEKSGVMTSGNTTFMNGFPIVAGHEYRVTFVSDTPVGKQFSIGLGDNGQFTPNISATTDTTIPQTRTKTATTSTDNSRIYFQFAGAPDPYPNITVKLEDLTDPTTFPKVLVHAGLETKLTRMIEAVDGGSGGSSNQSLYVGEVKQGLWTSNGRGSSVGLCGDYMVYPYNNMRIKVSLPETLSVQIVTGKNNGVLSVSGWLVNGDTYLMPPSMADAKYATVTSNESYYAVNFSDKDNHSQISMSAEDVMNMLSTGAIALEIEKCREYDLIGYNYSSDRYARRLMSQSRVIMVHCSDVHGDRYRHMHVLDYADSINADVVFNTGDSVAYNIADGGKFIPNDALNHQRPLMVSIGNHDMINTNAAGAFVEFISPLVTKCGYLASAGNAATENYYYIDDTVKSMRYITLFAYFGVTMTQTQVDWFVATLASVPSGYGVVVIMHTADKQPTSISTVFDNAVSEFTGLNLRGIVDLFISGGSGSVVVNSSITAVCDFTSAASHEFICWCAGHSHADRIGVYDDTTNRQVVCMVDAACAVQSSTPIPRGIEGCYQDSFNVLVVNRTTHKILVMKIGSNVKNDGTAVEYDEVSYV